MSTPPLLGTQQEGYPAGNTRIGTPSRGPIVPVAIEGARRPSHLAVPHDGLGRVVVEHQPLFSPKAPAFPFLEPPVLMGDPSPSLLRVAAARPAGQAEIQ